jgi:tripartite-type tricarboxylate transporter receptor subunit TctC
MRSIEHFRAKWTPVRVKKMRQNKNPELGSDLIRTEKALARAHLAALAFCVVASATAQAQTPAEFYAGKSVNLIISTGVGGGVDANARLVGRYLGNHIPGNPSILPRNMPGAGHIQATNYMYGQAPKDGTYIAAILPAFVLHQIIDGTGVQYDTKNFPWLGASDVDNMNLYVWKTTGVKSVADAQKTEVLMGATGAGSYTIMFPTLMNNLLGTKFKIVTGYKSTNEIHLAMQRGEVQGRAGNLFASLKSGNGDWLRDGSINLLVQMGAVRDPEFADVPLLHELATNDDDRRILKLFSAEAALGKPFLTTPGIPADRLAVLRAAFEEAMKDPGLLKDAKTMGIDVRPLKYDVLKQTADDIVNTPPELVAKAKAARGGS